MASGLVALSVDAPPAAAAPATASLRSDPPVATTVSLTSDVTEFAVGQSVTLTATANQLLPGGYRVRIFDTSTLQPIKTCTTLTCTYTAVPFTTGGPRRYIAEVSLGTTTATYGSTTDVLAFSNEIELSRLAWTVLLETDKVTYLSGESVTLTATANQSAGSGTFRIRIFDQTTGAQLRNCTSATCVYTGVMSYGPDPHTFLAEVSVGATNAAYGTTTDVQATSNPVVVTRATWTVTLTTDKSMFEYTEQVTWTATANQMPGGTTYQIRIFDATTGAFVVMCNDRTVCSFTGQPRFHYGAPHEYIAEVSKGNAYSNLGETTQIQATSNVVTLVAKQFEVTLTGSTALYETNLGGPRLRTSLTATLNQSVGATSSIRTYIINVTRNSLVGYCDTYTGCTRVDMAGQQPPETFVPSSYVAYVAPSSAPTNPYPTTDVLAISNGYSADTGMGPSLTGETSGGVNPSEKACQCSHADPVNTANGEFYLSSTDLGIPGVGPTLSIGRTYSSTNAATDGPFGYGWTPNFDARLVIVTAGTSSNPLPRQVKIVQENGSIVYFTKTSADLYVASSRVLAKLEHDDVTGTWTFVRKSREVFHFASDGRLDNIADLHGNSIAVSRDTSGKVATLSTGDGRQLTLSWTGSHVTSIDDSAGRDVTYSYDSLGNLKTVTAVDGGVSQFTYASGHYLLRQIAPDGGITENTYDSAHRVTKQVDPLGRASTFVYTATSSTITYPDASIVREVYQNAQLVSQTRGYSTPLASTTSYAYDNSNNVVSVTDPLGKVTQYTYDAHGNKLSQTDPLSRVTNWTYNGIDNVTSVADADGNGMVFVYSASGDMLSLQTSSGRSQSWTYNPDGTTATWTDNLGNVTTYSYDAAGRQTSATDPDGRVSQIGYDSAGRVTSTTDPAGKVTAITSDAAGRALTVTNPESETTTYDYDAAGNLTSVEDPSGKITTRAYDIAGQLLSVTDPTGSVSTVTYTPTGLVATSVDGEGNVTAYSYDVLGSLLSVTDPLNRVTTFTYDLAGRRLSTTSPSGAVSAVAYDDAGQTISATDADGQVTHFTYNGIGQLTQATDPLGRLTQTTYTSDGKVDTVTYPDLSTETYSYDALGQTTGFENADGKQTTYSYTDGGLLSEKVEPGGLTTSYAYDASGRLHLLARPDGSTSTYTYDDAGRTTNIHASAAGSTDVQFEYDPNGRRTKMVDVTGTSTYSYDDAGRLIHEQDGGGAGLAYAYDDAGRLTTVTYPGGHDVTYTYDAAGQMASVTDWLDNETAFAWNSDGLLLSQTYGNGVQQSRTYDDVGRTTGIATTGPGGAIAEFTYAYDHAGQLISDSLLDPISSTPASRMYAYDSIGQLGEVADVTSTGSFAATSAGALTQTKYGDGLSYNTAQQLTEFDSFSAPTTTFGYDGNGARTESVLAAHGTAPAATTTYGYDPAGALESVEVPATTLTSGVSLGYTSDGDGLRQTRTDGTDTQDFVWQSSRGLPLLVDDGEHSYIYGPSLAPIAQIGDATGTVTYLHGDLIGSTRVITDDNGDVVGTSRYDEYGNRIQVAGPTDSAIGYSGALTDPDSGLVYLRARDYDPSTMQFLAVDPAVDSTRQPYAYVANNPLTQTDPTGLDIWQQLATAATEKLTGAGQELLAGAAGVVDSFTGGASSALLGAVVPGYDCFISQHSVAFTVGKVVGVIAQIAIAIVAVAGSGGVALGPVLAGVAGRLALKASVKSAVAAARRVVASAVERLGVRGGEAAIGRVGIRDAEVVESILPTPRVASQKLQNLIDNLYKGTTNPNRVGNGTTMDAIRNEIATGASTGGKMHTIKGQETLQGLNNWLQRNADAPYHDRLVAQSIADELAAVLGSKP